MKNFKNFATRHPIAFGFVVIVLFVLLSTLVWPIQRIYPFPEGNEIGTALSKLVITACFMFLIWRFGWIKTAGFASLGHKRVWLFSIVMMVYNAIFAVYAFTGSFKLGLSSIDLTLAVIFFTFTTSLLEETMYRGLVLTALVKAWGSTRKGLFAVAIVSGLFWAFLHLSNLIVSPPPGGSSVSCRNGHPRLCICSLGFIRTKYLARHYFSLDGQCHGHFTGCPKPEF